MNTANNDNNNENRLTNRKSYLKPSNSSTVININNNSNSNNTIIKKLTLNVLNPTPISIIPHDNTMTMDAPTKGRNSFNTIQNNKNKFTTKNDQAKNIFLKPNTNLSYLSSKSSSSTVNQNSAKTNFIINPIRTPSEVNSSHISNSELK
jgi:hypothetical protein